MNPGSEVVISISTKLAFKTLSFNSYTVGFKDNLLSFVNIDVPTSLESLGYFVILMMIGLRELVLSIEGSPDKYKTFVARA
jgi:hypothetical protein